MTPVKTCKCCNNEFVIYAFPKIEKSGMRHSYCQHCVHSLRFGQIVRYWHYRRPDFKPTRGWNPYAEIESS